MNKTVTGCRCNGTEESHGFVLSFVVAVLGGGAVVVSHKYLADTPRTDENLTNSQLRVWISVLSATVGYGTGLFVYFSSRLWDIRRLFEPEHRPLWTQLGWRSGGGLAITVALLTWSSQFSVKSSTDLERDFASRIAVIRTALFILSLPAMIAFFVIRAVARGQFNWKESPSCELRLLLALRREHRRLLGALGVLLTLIVITTGLRRRSFLSLIKDADITVESVLLYGTVFLILLGLLHLVANTALDARSEDHLSKFAPLPNPDSPNFVDELKRYRELGGLIGVGGGWRSFESVALIAAPLLTALIGLVTHS
jgi:hypothetical protein